MEIEKSRLPLLAFGACCLLAIALAFLTGEWTSALAIALAGLALGFAMRVSLGNDEEVSPEAVTPQSSASAAELDQLRAALTERDAEIDTLRDSIDGLAEVIESLVEGGPRAAAHNGNGGEIPALRLQLQGVEDRLAQAEQQDPQVMERLKALESAMTRALAASEAQAQIAAVRSLKENPDPETVSHAQTAIASPPRDRLDKLRGLISGQEPGSKVAQTMENAASVLPMFGSDLRDPRALLVAAHDYSDPVAASVLALQMAVELADEDRSNLLFLPRIDPMALASEDFAGFAREMIDQCREAPAKLVPLTTQAALTNGLPIALKTMTERGVGFALEDIRDWAIDLPNLASSGLRYLMVDGPAMVRTAQSQRGDPSRLKAVLARSEIGLIANKVNRLADIEAVMALEPDLLIGDALERAGIREQA